MIWPAKDTSFSGCSYIITNAAAAAAAAAKSLQSCPTLCDLIDGSPPGFPVPGILQARTLEWVAMYFSSAWKWKVKVKSLSCVGLFTTPWTAAHQAPLPMGFSRQEYWSGVPLPSPITQTSANIWTSAWEWTWIASDLRVQHWRKVNDLLWTVVPYWHLQWISALFSISMLKHTVSLSDESFRETLCESLLLPSFLLAYAWLHLLSYFNKTVDIFSLVSNSSPCLLFSWVLYFFLSCNSSHISQKNLTEMWSKLYVLSGISIWS